MGRGFRCTDLDGSPNLHQRLYREVLQMGLLVGNDYLGRLPLDGYDVAWS